MTREEKTQALERMLKNLPELMSPMKVTKNLPFGKNRVYELIRQKELKAYNFQGAYIIAKIDLIEYLVDHWDDDNNKTYKIKKGDQNN